MLLHLGKSCAIIHFTTYGGLAQSVEHLLHMQGVTGSSPVVSTNKNFAEIFVTQAAGLAWNHPQGAWHPSLYDGMESREACILCDRHSKISYGGIAQLARVHA